MRKLLLLAGFAALVATPIHAQEATANFVDAEGLDLGTVTLTSAEGGVAITGHVMGIEPGEHGFHFHEVGDCDGSAAFESAGAHFNPTSHKHGMENPVGPHAGDLPNLTADAQGMVNIEATSNMVSLTEGEDGYVFDADGTALMIHANPDDNRTDPSGNSGDRIACAVIEAAPAL